MSLALHVCDQALQLWMCFNRAQTACQQLLCSAEKALLGAPVGLAVNSERLHARRANGLPAGLPAHRVTTGLKRRTARRSAWAAWATTWLRAARRQVTCQQSEGIAEAEAKSRVK